LKELESPNYYSEETRVSHNNLNSELTNLKAKYREVSNERQRLNEENLILKGKNVPKDLMKRVEDLSSQKENLSKENLQLLKVIKKLHRKAEDRKKNLKQLFELMTEKEKEIAQYKQNQGKTPAESKSEETTQKEKILESLNSQIKQKETELQNLEETLAKKNQDLKSQSRGHKRLLSEHISELERRKHKLEEVLANLPSEANSEIYEVREMITLLDKEKDEAIEKEKGNKLKKIEFLITCLSLGISSVIESPVLAIKIPPKKNGEITETNDQEEVIRLLELDKKDLEEKCQDLMNDIESLQEHKKRIEKNYKDEVRLMNTKVQELTDYIHELELKNTQRLKGSFGTEVLEFCFHS